MFLMGLWFWNYWLAAMTGIIGDLEVNKKVMK